MPLLSIRTQNFIYFFHVLTDATSVHVDPTVFARTPVHVRADGVLPSADKPHPRGNCRRMMDANVKRNGRSDGIFYRRKSVLATL
jgi:hypothetical protein